MTKRACLAALLVSSMLLSSFGQQQPGAPQPRGVDDGDEVVRITTNLVQVDAVVTKDGKQVTDLTADEFEILEDGRPQKITTFSYVSTTPAASQSPANIAAAPSASPASKGQVQPPVTAARVRPREVGRTIALVVDNLGMAFESMGQMKRLLRKFVDEQVQPNDLVAIIRTGGDMGATQQFTNDRRLLYGAIERMRWDMCGRVGISVLPPARGETFDNGLSPCGLDAMSRTVRALRFILEGMGRLPGRKSMVIFSDNIPVEAAPAAGFPGVTPDTPGRKTSLGDTGGGMRRDGDDFTGSLRRLAEIAVRSSVVIYGIDSRGVQYPGATAADDFSGVSWEKRDEIMRRRAMTSLRMNEGADLLTDQTGGFMIRGTNDLTAGLRRVMEEQKGYYLIGYRPGDETFDRRFHRIKVRVKRPGLTLRTRTGFYGVTDEETRSARYTPRDLTLLALASPFGAGDIDVRLTPLFADTPDAGAQLRSLLHVDARALTFTDEADGFHKATLQLTGILFGDNGNPVGEHSRTVTLRLRGEAYERALRDGVVESFDMPVKKSGAFQFRVAVRDEASARIGAAGQFVEIPDLGDDRLALSGIVLTNGVAAGGQDDDTLRSAAVRRFRQNAEVAFGYAVYNARLDKATSLPQLTTQTRIYGGGKLVFTSDTLPLAPATQPDPKRLRVNSRLRFVSNLTPGDYVLQVVVYDNLTKDKRRAATQWIDFEIVR